MNCCYTGCIKKTEQKLLSISQNSYYYPVFYVYSFFGMKKISRTQICEPGRCVCVAIAGIARWGILRNGGIDGIAE
jgi:hypothetical protein